jgi:hypothetical protein
MRFSGDIDCENMVWKLLQSEKILPEDREWLDKRSTKQTFRFSEHERIKKLYIQEYGQLPE